MRTRPIQSSSDPEPSMDNRPSESPVPTHISVLLHEAIDYLEVQEDDTVVDATLGGAGHAKSLASKLGPSATFIGFDLDHAAIERAQSALRDAKFRVELCERNFRELGSALKERSVREINKALFDLGWSSFQLNAGRGFSFNTNDPLLMTYATNPAGSLTAETIVNKWAESSLSDVFFGWGEERYARRIARAIVERRAIRAFSTANDLAETIASAVPPSYRYGRLHPATKTFQALRIAVNDELGALKDGLDAAWQNLKTGGRIAVITFHSIEDRQVKRYFSLLEKEGKAIRVTKKPIGPSLEEIKRNPRARSAKLRVIEKIPYEYTQHTSQ